MQVAGFADLRRLHDGGQSVVYRATRQADGVPVVLKMLRGPYPSPAERVRFRREHALLTRVAGEGVVRVEGWAEADGLPMIVLEDFGAESLERTWPHGPPPAAEALDVALATAKALARVHEARVLHLDVCPANIVRSAETGIVKLIDFGMSTDLPRQAASLAAERVLMGTLRYAAPEQTGRMNRSVDYRTDLYAFGATLYWLFSGRPPFVSDDPLELVHAHVARQPAPIGEVPASLSAVVLKLLEKNAQDRYQSIAGLLADLRACREHLAGASDAAFEPGHEDRATIFTLPERLYGREHQLATLLATFERAAGGSREVVLVEGSAGMGKTSLVEEVQRPVVERHGVYLAGKFDQFKRAVPYAGLALALRGCVRQILARRRADLGPWRDRLRDAVSPNGRLLTSLIPELELILGDQPELPVLPPLESEARLHRTVRRFVRELASASHPLVLFVDDLQWADLPSLSLLRVLATDPRQGHVLLIVSYRDDEVAGDHPVRAFVHEIEAAGVAVERVAVGPLAPDDVERLVGDTVRRRDDATRALAQCCAAKTGRNPFFLHRFLHSLAASDLLWLDAVDGWSWSLDAVRGLDVTHNVLGFLHGQLTLLPDQVQRTLEAASIVGHTFGVHRLALALEAAAEDVLTSLERALVEDLIEEVPHASGPVDPHFRFLHDRIHQAAYEQCAPDVRRTLHAHLGAHLLAETPEPETSDDLFEIVDHLNAGGVSRGEVAALNAAAGRRALAASAFAPALHYLSTSRTLLGPAAWDEEPERMRALTELAAHAAALLADYARMDTLLADAESHARHDLDRIRGQRIRIDALTVQNRTVEALELGLDGLQLLGIELPRSPGEADIVAGLEATMAALVGVDLPSLPDREPPDDEATRLAMEMLAVVAPPAYFINQALLPLLGVEIVRLTLAHGPAPESSYGFALLGLVLCDVGHIEQGCAFGEVAWSLTGRFDDKRMRVRAGHVYNAFSRHWKEPFPQYKGEYHALCELAIDIGDFEYAAYIGMMHTIFGFYLAPDLPALTRSAALYTSMMQETNQLNGLAVQTMVHQAILNLVQAPADPVELVGELFDEPTMLAAFRKLGDPTCLFVIWCLKSVLAGLHGEWSRALELAGRAREFIQGATATVHKVALEQWEALAALETALGHRDAPRREALVARAETSLEKLETWAMHNPRAHGHRPVLVRAQLARARGAHAAALGAFEDAARIARQHGRVSDEAVALRAAGELCLEAGWTTAARAYLIEARYAFERWGATGVVRALEVAHPSIVGNIAARSDRTGVSGSLATGDMPDLDVMAVVRASQAIAREIELEQLVRTVVRLSMEASGATRCVVVGVQPDGLQITAIGVAEPMPDVTLTTVALEASGEVPEGVIRLVAHTQEELLIADAVEAQLTAGDPYVVEHRPRSVLCLPIQQQGRLLAILYLEHASVAGMFTGDRVALLRVLLAQAAISTENAALVDTLEEKVRARTEQLAAASEAKSTFLRSMSHELRTPLNCVLVYTQLLLDGSLDASEQREALTAVLRSGRHLLSLINDVLDMNKIEAGRVELEPEPVELAGFVGGVAAMFRPDAERRGLGLEVSIDPALPRWIETDPRRLRQVLLNLVGNAVKFTETGAVQVQARVLGDELEVCIEDSGPGIAPSGLTRIFEPFEQAGSASQRAQGTGLGLTIARQIARQLGGEVTVDSTVGRGSTFRLTLPLVALEGPEVAPQPVVSSRPAAPLEPPPDEVSARLSALAVEGAYSELFELARELGERDVSLRPFAKRLAALAREFDDLGVARLLGLSVVDAHD